MADASVINTVDASVGNAFSERQVRELPLQTRNVVELLSLQPGVSPDGEVMGARRDQNNITLDGADVNNNQNSGLMVQNSNTFTGGFQGSNANGAVKNSGFNAVLPIPLDSVQEFRVTVAGEGPNQGRSSGGQVALITKERIEPVSRIAVRIQSQYRYGRQHVAQQSGGRAGPAAGPQPVRRVGGRQTGARPRVLLLQL